MAEVDEPPDLICAKCGYPLRGLPVTHACPECACPIADSIAAVAVDPRVEAPLRRLASSYWLDLAILLLPMLHVLAIGLLAAGTLVRVLSLCELRSRLARAWLPRPLESGSAFAALLALQVCLPAAAAIVDRSLWPLALGWLGSALIGAYMAGLAAGRIATALDHEVVCVQLRGQRAVLLGAAAVVGVGAAVFVLLPAMEIVQILTILLAVLAAIALGHTAVALSTLAAFVHALPRRTAPDDPGRA